MKWIFLDFGTYQIKALKAHIENKEVFVEDFAHLDSRPDFFEGLDFPTTQAWAATSVGLNELGWITEESAAISCQLPSSYLESRYLEFPFKSEKKIERVLPLELESSIPFDVDEILLRHRILKGPGIREAENALVYVLAYRRELIQKYEAELAKFQSSPPPISVDILNLVTLRQALPLNPVQGLLHIGHRKSHYILFQSNGNIIGQRTFFWGGENLRQAIVQALGVPEKKATEVLIERASFEVSKDSQSIDIKLADALEDQLNRFLNEFRQTMKAFSQKGLELPRPFPVYLLGRTSQTKGLVGRLNERFRDEFETEFLDYPLENLMDQVHGLNQIADPMSALTPLSHALAQTRAQRGKIPIFSESTFQFQQNLKRIQGESISLLKKVGMILIAPIVYLILASIIQGQESNKIEDELKAYLKKSNINVSLDQDIEDILLDLRIKNRTFIDKQSQLSEDRHSPLLVLSNLSGEIDRNLKVDFKEFRVNDAKILIVAETNSIQSSDAILKQIQQVYPEAKAGVRKACSTYKGCQSFNIEISRKLEE